MQLQGIDPFIELDISQLPSEGDTVEDTFGIRKVYGNVIDGIPGYTVRSDTGGMYSSGYNQFLTQSYQGTIKDDMAVAHRMLQDYIGTEAATHIHLANYSVDRFEDTLAGGALANEQILAAGTGSYSVLWAALSWDVAPAAAYTMNIHDNGGANPNYATWGPADGGVRRWLYGDQAATTALEVTYGGGAGAENLHLVLCYCEY